MKENEFTVTPYTVDGDINYESLLDQFGADKITKKHVKQFENPHHMLRRRIFYAHRDFDTILDSIGNNDPISIVTGRGPSGKMHIGHILPFYFVKHLQEQLGARVFIPLSDDEKAFSKNMSLAETANYTIENLKDILAVGFEPERTTILIDTADSDILYPAASQFAQELTPATVNAVYGKSSNIGMQFYPAIQSTHLLFPQLIHGEHSTLVPIAVDQDPHVRVSRDIAAKNRYDLEKPVPLLSKFLPSLNGPGKMSSSSDMPSIYLTDSEDQVRDKILSHAFSGGQQSAEEHRAKGGDPDIDVAYQLLYYFFMQDDERVTEIADLYRSGELLTGELKEIAVTQIADFLSAHQSRRPNSGDIEKAVAPYRLTNQEREQLRDRIGFSSL